MDEVNFLDDLKWRGLLQDSTPNIPKLLSNVKAKAYLGVDPTAPSLHIGHLCGIMMLLHFQAHGYTPIILVGGASGMIGDPSGKSSERVLLTSNEVNKNVNGICDQLDKIFKDSNFILRNNFEWWEHVSFLDFVRNIGKNITVNYMLAKDSVKKRLEGESGMSFTEFTYQLVQAYDFVVLNKELGCTIQIGGSDQWGNMTTGIDLMKKLDPEQEIGAITCPLLTKADGKKFGKTESGAIWLNSDPSLGERYYTSPYNFFQFWINTSDEDAERYIKIFTLLNREEIESIISEHKSAPEKRVLQKELAFFVTNLIHGREEALRCMKISELLFGGGSMDQLDEVIYEELSNIVDTYVIDSTSCSVLDLLTKTNIFSSRSMARTAITSNSISFNSVRYNEPLEIIDLKSIAKYGKYILVKTGKKKYHLLVLIEDED